MVPLFEARTKSSHLDFHSSEYGMICKAIVFYDEMVNPMEKRCAVPRL
jgi:hypothetical protein